MEISKKLSNGFRVANLIATILIVAIHYNSKMYMLPSETVQWNYLIQEYITNGIARIAVPFFAFSSGIFFFKNYCDFNSYKRNCIRRLHSLFVPYFVGGMIIFFSDSFILFLLDDYRCHITLYNFIYKIFLNPYVHQLWFVRDLIVLSLISPIIIFLSKSAKLIYVVVLILFWIVNYNFFPKIFDLYLINIETLLFFSLGCYLTQQSDFFNSIFHVTNKKIIYGLLVASFLLFAVRVFINPLYFNSEYIGLGKEVIVIALCQKIAILIGGYALILISSEVKCKQIIYLSGFTFFVYIYHARPLFRFVLKSGSFFIQDKYLFYYSVPIATSAAFFMALFLNRYFPKAYILMTGGRCPQDNSVGEKSKC